MENSINNGEFAVDIEELVDDLQAVDFELEDLACILRIMERHERFDFGAPGALVHLLERFYKRGYEELLLESIARKPTSHTVWMLNRVINGIKNSKNLVKYIRVMRDVSDDTMVDDAARKAAQHFLGLHTWSLLMEEGIDGSILFLNRTHSCSFHLQSLQSP